MMTIQKSYELVTRYPVDYVLENYTFSERHSLYLKNEVVFTYLFIINKDFPTENKTNDAFSLQTSIVYLCSRGLI